MRAITVLPGIANSARLDEVPEPPLSEGPVLVVSPTRSLPDGMSMTSISTAIAAAMINGGALMPQGPLEGVDRGFLVAGSGDRSS